MSVKKLYEIVYADPPWTYKDKAKSGQRGVEFKYSTMSMSEIMALNVREHVADNAILFLWVTAPLMFQQVRVMQAWGFRYKTLGFDWVKRAQNGGYKWGMGNWTRSNAELCLIGIRGKPKRVSASVHQIVDAIPGQHSEKPPEVREHIVRLMGDLPRVEMFAREKAPGWDVFGDEVDSDVIFEVTTGAQLKSKLQRLRGVRR